MDKYELVEEVRQNEEIGENEVRIQQQGKPRKYISYAVGLLTEKNVPTVTIKAMGRAISKTVTVAEIIKRRVPGLHQITELSSVEIVDVYRPLEEGLDVVRNARSVSCIKITLSKEPLDTRHPGYQAPLPEDEVVVESPPAPRTSVRGRGRGGRHGRGRGRGRRDTNGRAPAGEEGETKEAGGEQAAGGDAAPGHDGGAPGNGERRGGRGGGRRGRGGRGRGRRGGRGRGGAGRGEGGNAAAPATEGTA